MKTRRLQRTQRSNAMLWLADGDGVWLVQRPARGVWAGLWALPLYDSLEELQSLSIAWPGRGRALAPLRHALTHFDWHLQPWHHQLPQRMSAVRRAALETALPEGRWFSRDAALRQGLPAPVRRLLLEP